MIVVFPFVRGLCACACACFFLQQEKKRNERKEKGKEEWKERRRKRKMIMRFVSVLLVAMVGCRLVVADLSCDYYLGRYYMVDINKCWAYEIDVTFNDGCISSWLFARTCLMDNCGNDGTVSEDRSKT